ncbi:MAG: threonine/serine exporter family protein [Faecalibacterium sp.]
MIVNDQLVQMLLQFLLAAAGTLFFAIRFAVPGRTLLHCGLVGGVGWLVYELAILYGMAPEAASLLAVIPLTMLSRAFAIMLKSPVTVFLLCGIFPLVPGAGIYYTAYYFIQGENDLAVVNGISTFKIAVALAVGISVVLSLPLPKRWFLRQPRKRRK